MSEIDYFGIEEAVADILLTDSRTRRIGDSLLKVEIEEPFNLIPDKCPWVGIYLDSWDSPAEEERIGGNSPFLTYLILELWLYEFAMESRTASQLRDRLLRKVKETLKDNRKLNNKVLIWRFAGGEFDSPATSEGFFRGVSLKLECEVRE